MKTTHELSKAIQDLHNTKMDGIKKAARAENIDAAIIAVMSFIAAVTVLMMF